MSEINWDGAIQELQQRGRIKGEYENAKGQVCALGAVMRAHGKDARFLKDGGVHLADVASRTLAPIIMEQFPDRFDREASTMGAVVEFNDDGATTDGEVILLFEKARANAGSTWGCH